MCSKLLHPETVRTLVLPSSERWTSEKITYCAHAAPLHATLPSTAHASEVGQLLTLDIGELMSRTKREQRQRRYGGYGNNVSGACTQLSKLDMVPLPQLLDPSPPGVHQFNFRARTPIISGFVPWHLLLCTMVWVSISSASQSMTGLPSVRPSRTTSNN